MNLALITQDFPPEVGGIETYATELARRFNSCCEHFIVVAPHKALAAQTDRSLPYPVQRIQSSNPFLGIKALPDIPVLLREQGIRNVFHTQWQTLPAAVFARQQGAVGNIFVAAHGRELLFNPFSAIPGACQGYEKYKRWILSQVDVFFPVSSYTADLLVDHGIEKDRIQVVINGTDPQQFYPTDTAAARRSIGVNTEKVMLTITRLVSRKGVDTALRAFQQVLQNHPDSRYLVVGEGENRRQMQRLASELGIAEFVEFRGRVPHQNLLDYYNACDVFVMPSKTEPPNVEGFGIVFLEANACGKPVVGTFSGGIPSAIVNETTGILVEENDPDSVAEAITRLFSDNDLAKKMGRAGRHRVEKEANWNKTAQKLFQGMESKISETSTLTARKY